MVFVDKICAYFCRRNFPTQKMEIDKNCSANLFGKKVKNSRFLLGNSKKFPASSDNCIASSYWQQRKNVEILASKTMWEMRKKCVKICWLNISNLLKEFRYSSFFLKLCHHPSSTQRCGGQKIENWCATNCQKVPKNWLLWTLIAHLHRWWTNIPCKGKVNFVGGFSWP